MGLPAVCGAAALTWRVALPPDHPESLGERIVAGVVLLSVGTGLVLGVRRRFVRELRHVRAVADAAQSVLLRPLPPRLDRFALAASQLSASPGASVGGDLYEALATPHGVRVVIGDVRGHGLPAIGAVAAVLGSFREAAYDEPELGGVLRRLDRAVQRHLRERAREEHPAACEGEPHSPSSEEFVTVLLLEIGPDGRVLALNCGHPWPYRLGTGTAGARPLTGGDPLPPLGLFPLPAELEPHRWDGLLPGESLVLHTDGAVDARDPAGRFFGLEAVLERAALDPPPTPAAVITAVHAELLRHTGGRLTDDVALLVLRDDRSRVPARYGEAVPRRTRRNPPIAETSRR
ncbi:PP2C family protein-serine/threonine phosphatase [Streptomyces sp. NPDC051018]|uniref:PP2C family protein-serine/threonine phosphatase n=1 Tax=Streptomyces sp. NPDC051018 TaxID=3365639 RepID=UPI0037A42E2A